jgi:hypothetical protein
MLSILIIAFILYGCKGSSGGGSAATDTAAPTGTSNTVPPVISNTNGNNSYYSLTSSGLTHADVSVPPAGSQEITGHLFMNYSGGVFEFGVYAPTCLAIGDYKDYSLLNITYGNNTDPTNLSFSLTHEQILSETDAFDSNWFTKAQYGNGTSLTPTNGTCTNGKMTLDNGDEFYANGKAIVYKKLNGSMYIGLSEDVVLDQAIRGNTIAELLWSTNGNYVQSFVSRATGTFYTTEAYTYTPTTLSFFGASYTKKYMDFAGVGVWAGSTWYYNYSAAITTMLGIIGVINGKIVNIMASPNSGTTITYPSALLRDTSANSHYFTNTGNKATLVTIEQ